MVYLGPGAHLPYVGNILWNQFMPNLSKVRCRDLSDGYT